DDPDLDLGTDIDVEQRVLESLDRTGTVTLEDEVQGVDLALLQPVLERDALTGLGQLRVTAHGLTTLRDLTGDAVFLGDEELVTSGGYGGEAQHLHRTRRSGFGERVAVLVEHRPDATERVTGNDRVADVQRASLHQHRCHRTTATVEVSLDRDTTSVLVGHGAQVERRVGGEQDRLEQLVDVDALTS